jgi:rhamnogalacturonyl hydrolase YesR
MGITKMLSRCGQRVALGVLMGLAVSAGAQSGISNPMAKDTARLPADISRAVVETTMQTHPSATELGNWGYTQALYLYGEYLVYERTHDPRYLAYIKSWADAHVDAQGKIDKPINALDYMLPGNIMLILYHETGETKYKVAATEIWNRLTTTYPRTKDGGFWHATSRQHQLWLDGTYMALPFMVHYGEAFGQKKYAYDEASKQLLIYASHLNDPTSGLLFHAYDESGTQKWADAMTHHEQAERAGELAGDLGLFNVCLHDFEGCRAGIYLEEIRKDGVQGL